MADEESGDVQAKKPGIFENKIVVVAAIVVLQAAMAFVLAQFVIAPAATPQGVEVVEGEGEEETEAAPRGVLVSLEEMIVSLNSGARPRYLRTTISVEAADAAAATSVEERMAEFRDATIMALSHHAVEDLLSFEGKEAVKAEIKDSLKALMDEGLVLNVFYSDFVVQ